MKQPRDDPAALTLRGVSRFATASNKGFELQESLEWEGATDPVLCDRSGKSNKLGIDLAPRQRQNLHYAPPCNVPEVAGVTDVLRKIAAHGFPLLALEESASRISHEDRRE
jgi:hypothetical protein